MLSDIICHKFLMSEDILLTSDIESEFSISEGYGILTGRSMDQFSLLIFPLFRRPDSFDMYYKVTKKPYMGIR